MYGGGISKTYFPLQNLIKLQIKNLNFMKIKKVIANNQLVKMIISSIEFIRKTIIYYINLVKANIEKARIMVRKTLTGKK
jgi:hypothetical protein